MAYPAQHERDEMRGWFKGAWDDFARPGWVDERGSEEYERALAEWEGAGRPTPIRPWIDGFARRTVVI